jgi:MFS family permease
VPPAIVAVSVVLQFAHQHSATTVGLALLPFSVLVIVGSSVGGRWLAADRRPGAFVTFGTVCATALAGLTVALGHQALWPVPVLMGVLGLGFGAVAVAATTVALRSVPSELGGAAGAIVNTTTQLAVAGGIAAFVTAPVVLSGATSASSISIASVPHLQVATAVAAACCLCLVLLDLRSSARRRGTRERSTVSVERSST